MKRPTWATVVGVLGIILSSLGVLGAGQFMMMPKMMQFQKEMMAGMQESMEKQESTKDREMMPPKEMFKMFEKMWDTPEWYATWCIVAGLLSLLISGFYLFASITLLQVKPSAIRLFYTAVGLSIGLALLKGFAAASAMSFMGLAMLFGSMCGVVIDIVLVIVVATGDKEAFIREQA
jgi:hypothetical protein